MKTNFAGRTARLAVQALLYEVCTTPKPGLVDRANCGSHADMDIFTFINSAAALFPYFEICCAIGAQTAAEAPTATFAALRRPGMEAEDAMLCTTGGVNTHKGAVFSMGILCGAVGRLEAAADRGDTDRILAECAAMTAGVTAEDFAGVTPENAATVGQRLYALYGITGVRGQAEAGFPTVREWGLPVLEQGLAMGKSFDEAGCAALLTMLAHAVDTNMIARSCVETAREVSSELRALLETDPYPDKKTLQQLDSDFIRRNLSPGGSADLLALCYFLHFLKESAL